MKIHFCHLHAPFRGRFAPNSLNVAHYAALIRNKFPTKCDVHLTESNFQKRPGVGREKLIGDGRLALYKTKGVHMKNNLILLKIASSVLIILGAIDIIASTWFIAATLMGSKCWMRVMFVDRGISMITMLVMAILALPKLVTGLLGLKACRLNKAANSGKILGTVSLVLELLYLIGNVRGLVWAVVKNLAVPSSHIPQTAIPMIWSGLVVLVLLGFFACYRIL